MDHRGGERRLWLCIGVRRDASRTTTRRPRVDTRGSGCTVDLERWWCCGAALRGLTPHAALSMLWSFAALRRAKHHGASFLHNVCWHHNMLSAARGVSPFKRPAAPLCSLLTVRSEPQVSTWGRRCAAPRCVSPHPDAQRLPSLLTPMHNHNLLFPPRCTTTTAYPHPDVHRSPIIPTPMIQRSPTISTPMHNHNRLSAPRRSNTRCTADRRFAHRWPVTDRSTHMAARPIQSSALHRSSSGSRESGQRWWCF
jgi:hypothetical protein